MLTEILKLKSSWETLRDSDKPIVLYGTGDGADKIIDEFERLGIKLSGVTASDGFVRERSFRGFKVKRLGDFEEEYGDFIIAVGFGTKLQDVIDNIVSISKKHKVLVPCVPVYGDTVFNRQFILQNSIKLENVYNILYDELSREVFLDVLRFELTGELKYLFRSETSKDEAFKKILRLGDGEHYLDLGAYRGDTVDEFLSYTGNSFSHITALEPDERNFSKLRLYASGINNITLIKKGIWYENGYLRFKNSAGRNNSVSLVSDRQCEVTTVDSLQSVDSFTYIKADVEGCEGQMLYGAFETLKNKKPKLNIAVYHRSEDIFEIPLKIKETNPDYKIFLRHHRYIPCWDMNLYCI